MNTPLDDNISNDELIALLWRALDNGVGNGFSLNAPDHVPPESQPISPSLPFSLSKDALYGLPGDIVRAVDPYTESSQVAVLLTVLVYFGSIIGRGSYFMIETTPNYANLFIGIVGATAKGRKGTSQSHPDYIYSKIDPEWKASFSGGLASGEALVSEVQDGSTSRKRLIVVEEEFSRALKVMARETNTLSEVIRNAWDGRTHLRNVRAQSKVVATDAHISIIAHTTPMDLKRFLQETDQANGFGNRFLWAYSERSKQIPFPLRAPDFVLTPLIAELKETIEFAKTVGEVRYSPEAEALWKAVYYGLEAKPGMYGSMTARDDAQMKRLSMIYALMDRSSFIQPVHIKAAQALWDYCDRSVKHIFGDSTGDSRADKLIDELKERKRLTRTEISDLFKRNLSRRELDEVIKIVLNMGVAEWRTEGRQQGAVIAPTEILCWKGD